MIVRRIEFDKAFSAGWVASYFHGVRLLDDTIRKELLIVVQNDTMFSQHTVTSPRSPPRISTATL